MDQETRHQLAETLSNRGEEVRERLNQALQDLGFEGLEITEFQISPVEDQARILRGEAGTFSLEAAAPCPTVCRLMPSGAIRCFPRC